MERGCIEGAVVVVVAAVVELGGAVASVSSSSTDWHSTIDRMRIDCGEEDSEMTFAVVVVVVVVVASDVNVANRELFSCANCFRVSYGISVFSVVGVAVAVVVVASFSFVVLLCYGLFTLRTFSRVQICGFVVVCHERLHLLYWT